jgi:hypothetical protein
VERHNVYCQNCNHKPLTRILSLGYMPPVNWMVPINEPASEQTWLPTDLMHCPQCELVQLGYIAKPELVFPKHYPYTSGSTKILRDNFEDLAEEACDKLALKRGDLVIDIGSNDGTLLSNFKKRGMRVLGIEPTDIAKIASSSGIETIQKFFDFGLASLIRQKHGAAKLVTCANCFAHMLNIHSVVRGINMLLAKEGIFISENHYLIDLINTLQYDTIYHEHLRYYSLRSLDNLLSRHELSIIYRKFIPTHGGSVRVYAAATPTKFIKGIDEEPHLDHEMLSKFVDRVLHSRRDLMSTVHRLKTQGRVVGIGAPSRASTVINYCRLDVDLIDYVAERTGSLKIGRFMPGTRIPVVDEQRLIDEQPEAAIVFSWHIRDEIEKTLRAKGYKGELINAIGQ